MSSNHTERLFLRHIRHRSVQIRAVTVKLPSRQVVANLNCIPLIGSFEDLWWGGMGWASDTYTKYM